MTAVVIADDHPIVRQGLRAVLEATEDLHVVAEATDGHEAVRACVEHEVEVILMDLQMPRLHGIDATRELRRVAPDTATIVLTMYEDDDTVFAAIAAGAVGYLLKGADGNDVISAIRAAATGQIVFGSTLAQRVQDWFGRGRQLVGKPFPELTDRERQILDGVAAGLTNAEIGNKLFLSPKTVANNVTHILDKLRVADRAEASTKAREAGLGRE